MTQFSGDQPTGSADYDVSVDQTKNTPDPSPDGPDGEVALDIQMAAAAYYVATGQAAKIRVYWSQDIATAVRAATADHCDVCSISWGADEAIGARSRPGNGAGGYGRHRGGNGGVRRLW